ncbi:hypothetical protein AGMMS50229_09160 [Campylobacterota bacterium]|nr:hypothetical protein AGMMS50229_09160 [Campylobacterota bacterium]
MRVWFLAGILCTLLFGEEFIRSDLPLIKPFGTKYALHQSKPAKEQPLQALARVYASRQVEYENLKAVTLAMMMLESGRGKSDLAMRHNNFGGLKYRPEMAKIAKKVRYRANDGFDFYCQFDSLDSFIEGFWFFLDRKPYQGWRSHTKSEQAFLEFIAPIYCPFNDEYISSVMRLLPEAKALLAQSSGYRVAIR